MVVLFPPLFITENNSWRKGLIFKSNSWKTFGKLSLVADLSRVIFPKLLLCFVQTWVFCEFTFKKNNVSVSEKSNFLVIIIVVLKSKSCQI